LKALFNLCQKTKAFLVEFFGEKLKMKVNTNNGYSFVYRNPGDLEE